VTKPLVGHMTTSLKTLLSQLGLSQNESLVYIALSRLGEALVQEVSHEAKLPRTTVASILERLKDLGFVTVHKTKGKFVYWIEDPHVLVTHEKTRLDVAEQLAARLHLEYHKADKKPTVEIYETKAGIQKLMTKVITDIAKGAEFLVFESPIKKHYQAVLSEEFYHAMAKLKEKKGIRTRALIPSGHQEFIRPKTLEYSVEVRALPSGVAMEISFWILDSSIVLFYGEQIFAMKMNHQHTQESMKSLFEYLWSQSNPLIK